MNIEEILGDLPPYDRYEKELLNLVAQVHVALNSFVEETKSENSIFSPLFLKDIKNDVRCLIDIEIDRLITSVYYPEKFNIKWKYPFIGFRVFETVFIGYIKKDKNSPVIPYVKIFTEKNQYISILLQFDNTIQSLIGGFSNKIIRSEEVQNEIGNAFQVKIVLN